MALHPNPQTQTRVLLLVACCGFLFFYGLGSFGLVGADEPRYAQVAREMLSRHDWITPTLQGQAWLEKPVLYYWQAMFSFRLGGMTSQMARIPSALDASLLVAVIYFFLRRFYPGSEVDGAVITASSAGIIAFARAAATDMALAATLSIALLAWYAWYEAGQANLTTADKRSYLAIFYVFLALGTLAKGPVAPAFAAIIIFIFCMCLKDWSQLKQTFWAPGIALYLVVVLPWYVAVQLRNPEFFRVFILQHNLARFSQDVYHHRQPFWFYGPVFLLAMLPWSFVLLVTVVVRLRDILARRKNRFSYPRFSWQIFLFVWMTIPIAFFSVSQSKLPGYILPSVPAGALLIADYLASLRREQTRIEPQSQREPREREPREPEPHEHRLWRYVAVGHGLLCGLLIFIACLTPGLLVLHRPLAGRTTYIGALLGVLSSIVMSATLLSRSGLRLLSRVTLIAVVISVAVVVRLGAPIIDATQSAYPIAESIQAFSRESVPLAVYGINRAQQYGLEFYLNKAAQAYEKGSIPTAPHVLVTRQNSQAEVATAVPGRRVSYLASFPAQKLDLYWIGK